ncbi:MAG: AAA family ATPase [Porticoccaceae bacterium]
MTKLTHPFFIDSEGQLIRSTGHYGEMAATFTEHLSQRFTSPEQIISERFGELQAAAASIGALLDAVPVMDGAPHYLPNNKGQRNKQHGYFAEFVQAKDGAIIPRVTFHTFKQGGHTEAWYPRDDLWKEWEQAKESGTAPAADPERLNQYQAKAEAMKAAADAKRAALEAEANKGQTAAAQAARIAWAMASPADQHEYLSRKQITGQGLRVADEKQTARLWSRQGGEWIEDATVCNKGDLLIPLFHSGELVNLQRITPEGKRFIMGGQTAGAFHRIEGAAPAFIAEGYATAATVAEITGRAVICAFSAGNMPAVAEIHKSESLTVAADNDPAGIKAATNAGLPYIAPPADGQDWNDYANQNGTEAALMLLQQKPEPVVGALINGWDMADDASAPSFLIDGILEEDANGIIGGASMTYKSFIVLRMAWSICTGEAFMGRKVFRPGPVVYVCGEGQGAIMRRLKALKLFFDSTPDHPIYVIGDGVNLASPESMEALQRRITDAAPVLVIFDTFASISGGAQENDNSEVGAVLNLARDTCRAVGASSLIVHHFGKDSEKGFRGASAFVNNVDFAFTAKKIGSQITELACYKMKDGEHFSPITMAAEVVPLGIHDQNGRESTSLVVIQTERAKTPGNDQDSEKGTHADRAYAALVRQWRKQVETLEAGGKMAENPLVTYSDWKEEVDKLQAKINLSKEAGKLVKAGRIERIEGRATGGQFRPRIPADDAE